MQPIDDDLDRNPVFSDPHPTPWRIEALDGGVDDYQILDANGLAIAGCGPYDPPTVSKVEGERIVRLVNGEAEVVAALESAERAMATDARDWSATKGDAWLWAILVGWGDALGEVAARHGWSAADVARLEQYRAALAKVRL